MSESQLSDAKMSALLVAVGVEAPASPVIFDSNFADLEVDSLGRTELATRLADQFGIDIQEDLTPETTPNAMRQLVTGGIRR